MKHLSVFTAIVAALTQLTIAAQRNIGISTLEVSKAFEGQAFPGYGLTYSPKLIFIKRIFDVTELRPEGGSVIPQETYRESVTRSYSEAALANTFNMEAHGRYMFYSGDLQVQRSSELKKAANSVYVVISDNIDLGWFVPNTPVVQPTPESGITHFVSKVRKQARLSIVYRYSFESTWCADRFSVDAQSSFNNGTVSAGVSVASKKAQESKSTLSSTSIEILNNGGPTWGESMSSKEKSVENIIEYASKWQAAVVNGKRAPVVEVEISPLMTSGTESPLGSPVADWLRKAREVQSVIERIEDILEPSDNGTMVLREKYWTHEGIEETLRAKYSTALGIRKALRKIDTKGNESAIGESLETLSATPTVPVTDPCIRWFSWDAINTTADKSAVNEAYLSIQVKDANLAFREYTFEITDRNGEAINFGDVPGIAPNQSWRIKSHNESVTYDKDKKFTRVSMNLASGYWEGGPQKMPRIAQHNALTQRMGNLYLSVKRNGKIILLLKMEKLVENAE